MHIVYLSIVCLFFLNALQSQTDTTRMFIFGNSTINHEPNGMPSDEATVPHWVYLLAQEGNHYYAAGGQYGFLPQFASLNLFSQWGYSLVPSVWESDYEPFSSAEVSSVLITGANFIQWQPPSAPYPYQGGITPLSTTETLLDWLVLQEDSMSIYIYENWPDMSPYLGSGFPPNQTEFDNYNSYTSNDFHNWWLEYQDSLLIARPEINVRMIPVGLLLTELFEGILSDLPILDIYEDDAPHGTNNLYFLAGLITYMSIYNEPAPSTFQLPASLHSEIHDNYTLIVDYVWNGLESFNDPNGNSRVFYETGDSDGDGVPDISDVCPGGDDTQDADGDMIPDDCDFIEVELFAFLEGGLISESNTMNTNLQAANLLPLMQPFTFAPYNYTESIVLEEVPNNAVDWVLVEARFGDPSIENLEIQEAQAGILLADGSIVNADGEGSLQFRNLVEGQSYYFTVRHRNHLDIMTLNSFSINGDLVAYDFRVSAAYGLEQQKQLPYLGGTINAMFSGDYNGDGVIQTTDYDEWKLNPAALNVYGNADGNLDATIQATDYDLWFANPAKVGEVY